jgi:hypothetical protein
VPEPDPLDVRQFFALRSMIELSYPKGYEQQRSVVNELWVNRDAEPGRHSVPCRPASWSDLS